MILCGKPIVHVCGDTLAMDVQFEGDVGTVSDVALSARRDIGADSPLFTASVANGRVTQDSDGWHVRVPPAATEDATPGSYLYWLKYAVGDDVYTVMTGTLQLLAGE